MNQKTLIVIIFQQRNGKALHKRTLSLEINDTRRLLVLIKYEALIPIFEMIGSFYKSGCA